MNYLRAITALIYLPHDEKRHKSQFSWKESRCYKKASRRR